MDAKRIYKKDSFNFIIETLGIYSNSDIIKKACTILTVRLDKIKDLLNNDKTLIFPSETTIPNCYDITLVDEDYTIGKMIEFILHSMYYEKLATLSYVGFLKKHPHDDNSLIRIAFKEDMSLVDENFTAMINNSIEECKFIIKGISEQI